MRPLLSSTIDCLREAHWFTPIQRAPRSGRSRTVAELGIMARVPRTFRALYLLSHQMGDGLGGAGAGPWPVCGSSVHGRGVRTTT